MSKEFEERWEKLGKDLEALGEKAKSAVGDAQAAHEVRKFWSRRSRTRRVTLSRFRRMRASLRMRKRAASSAMY